jgi:DNA (cytosine-5)-methyltransferase 1
MKYLSLCSGIESATVAWEPLGWTAVAFAEIEPFPCAVLAHRFPGVPNWGDITQFKEWPDATFDVLVGGTPCQSFSVAGLRAGLDDPRGNLALTYLAILDRYRPTWCVWENVPGVLSSGGGRDLGAFLGALGQLGYGWAYRVLDAQFFGVAQRRRRVFVVAHLGARGWQRAAAVLFDRESLSGHPPPRRKTRQGIADGAVSRALSRVGGDDVGANKGAPLIVSTGDISHCLNAGAMGRIDYETETMIAHAFQPRIGRNGRGYSEDVVAALNGADAGATSDMRPCVAFADVADPIAANQARTYTREGTNNFRLSNVAHTAMAVRRLTPRECERLQGFPDDYTLVPYRGKLAVDGPRYKALGNAMAVPVMHWIGRRLDTLTHMVP